MEYQTEPDLMNWLITVIIPISISSASFYFCFGTIRNNTALKLIILPSIFEVGFGTIRNNTALKPTNVC